MTLLEKLRRLGDRLGIVELSSAGQPSAPMKIETRSITLTELVMTIRTTEVQMLAERPAGLSTSFDDIFRTAGIQQPPSGWTVDRLEEFLGNDRVRGLGRAETQREIARELAAKNVDPADVIKDAISRDQALDAFADSMAKRREGWMEAKKQEIRELEREIADEEKEWNEWRRKKRQREQDMARAIGHLIDKPMISIDSD